jgi:hypothetical protein
MSDHSVLFFINFIFCYCIFILNLCAVHGVFVYIIAFYFIHMSTFFEMCMIFIVISMGPNVCL